MAARSRGDCGPIGAESECGPRYSFRGAVEPNVCQWASTVVPRHRVGGPRPPAKALPYATGTAMCTIYPFSLSLSLPFLSLSLSPILSLLSLSLSLPYFAAFRSLAHVYSPFTYFPFVPRVRGDTHARNAFSVPLPLSPDQTFRFPSRAMRLFPRSFLVT